MAGAATATDAGFESAVVGGGRDDRRSALIAAAGWLVGALVFFRDQVTSGFDTVTGDRGDARLVVFLHEHWWQVIHGDRPWRTPPMFHPEPDVLAYADTFVLNQVLYLPLRLVGVEPFLAFQLCLVALTAVGYAATFRLVHRYLCVPVGAACCLAAATAFANNLFVDSGHSQMYVANVIPLIVLLAVEAWRRPGTRAGIAAAGCAGVLLGVTVWSNFYVGWFAFLAGGVAGAIAVALGLVTRRLGAVAAEMRRRAGTGAAALAGLVLGLAGFAVTYWPAITDSRARSYDEVANYAPRPFDLVNVGRDNVMWGWALRAIVGGDDPRLTELHRAVALTPVLFVTALVAGVLLALRARRTGLDLNSATGIVAAATALVLAVLPVQFAFGGLWAWTHRFVPGGDAIRVYGRLEVVNGFVACIAVACWWATIDREPRRSRWLVAGLAAIVVVEQVNTTDRFRQLDRSVELAALAAVPAPPTECESFHVISPADRDPDHASIDAMLIAQRVGIPTVNGYSGWQPDGWDLRPDGPDYPQLASEWVERSELQAGHCVYDVAASAWTPPATSP